MIFKIGDRVQITKEEYWFPTKWCKGTIVDTWPKDETPMRYGVKLDHDPEVAPQLYLSDMPEGMSLLSITKDSLRPLSPIEELADV